eukprot:CAMPEP_0198219656 /NCGR_PEP_ID=MMETSP1445-20131203/75559_1 /TAXON_ID=36898 /ORGANISM="Pyramimonas sp., Strain CCMP2087" /LENGTH=54 /DNA_ID=CAMNT_0043897157 /DNA_START=20 /DNA_END=184 /DNA_ORIENTATION=+
MSSSGKASSKKRFPAYISYRMTPKLHISEAMEHTMVALPLTAACTTSGAAYLKV